MGRREPEPKLIRTVTVGGGQTAKLLGAADCVPGYVVKNEAYATRSGNHGDAVGRGGRLVDWRASVNGPDLVANTERMLTQMDPPDLVLVGTPPFITPDVMRVVLANTPPKTVVAVEKPGALASEDAEDIGATIHRTGRLVPVGFQWTAQPTLPFFEEHALGRLERGDEIERIRARWHGDTFFKAGKWWRNPNEGGGPIIEQGHPGHLVDYVFSDHLGKLRVSDQTSPSIYYGVPQGVDLPIGVDQDKISERLYVPTQVSAELVMGGVPVLLEASAVHEAPEAVDVDVLFRSGDTVSFGKKEAAVLRGGKMLAHKTTKYPGPAFTEQMKRVLDAVAGRPSGPFVTWDRAMDALGVSATVMSRAEVVDEPIFPFSGLLTQPLRRGNGIRS